MPAYSSSVYRQAMVVLDSSSGSPEVLPPLSPDPAGNYAYMTQLSSNVTGFSNVVPQQGSLILGTTFSSVPVVLSAELTQDYQELGQALREMTELEGGDELKIDRSVYHAACYFAAELMAHSFPAPRVFNHGSSSVVFNWSNQADNLYLTIGADHMSALISTPARIKRRVELSTAQFMNPSLALPSVRAAFSGEPVKVLTSGAVADQSDPAY